jgi:hypothetical protein
MSCVGFSSGLDEGGARTPFLGNCAHGIATPRGRTRPKRAACGRRHAAARFGAAQVGNFASAITKTVCIPSMACVLARWPASAAGSFFSDEGVLKMAEKDNEEMSPEEWARSRLSSEDRKTFDAMCKARDARRARDSEATHEKYLSSISGEKNRQGDRAKDDGQSNLEGEGVNALDEMLRVRGGAQMNAYEIARNVRARIVDEMRDLRQAERDVAQHCGMAFDGDSAEEVYRSALEHHFGVPRSKTASLSASHLRVVLTFRFPDPRALGGVRRPWRLTGPATENWTRSCAAHPS